MEDPKEPGFTFVDKRARRADPAAPGPSPDHSKPVGVPPASALGREPDPDLAALFFMLASSALIHLGKSPDPLTGAARPDLAQARLAIDLLRLLQDKTDGHRTAEESQLLEQLLYDLQMQFVETAREVG
jgi:hypothetical protein